MQQISIHYLCGHEVASWISEEGLTATDFQIIRANAASAPCPACQETSALESELERKTRKAAPTSQDDAEGRSPRRRRRSPPG